MLQDGGCAAERSSVIDAVGHSSPRAFPVMGESRYQDLGLPVDYDHTLAQSTGTRSTRPSDVAVDADARRETVQLEFWQWRDNQKGYVLQIAVRETAEGCNSRAAGMIGLKSTAFIHSIKTSHGRDDPLWNLGMNAAGSAISG